MKKMTILAALCCCFVLASCGGGNGGNTPSELVLKFHGLAKEDGGDMKRAMAYVLENTDFSAVTPEAAEKTKSQMTELSSALSEKMVAEVEKHGGIESFEIAEEVISEDGLSATVTGKSLYKDGESGDESTMNFVKVDGKWMFAYEGK
jgi:hypothetical protein